MRLAVVDASAVVELLRGSDAGHTVARLVSGATMTAPSHLDAEVMSALARMARADPSEEPLVSARLAALSGAPIARYPCPPFLGLAWSLRANVAVRDALYIALARRLGAKLVTADQRLARVPPSVLGVVVQAV